MRSLIGKLAWSNIRKRKSATITLFVLIMIAALLLNIGLTVSLKLNSFQQEKISKLNTPDITAYFPLNENVKNYESLVDSYPYTETWENEAALLLPDVKINYGGNNTAIAFLILNKDSQRSMGLFNTTSRLEPADQNTIYLPYIFHGGSGYNLGDTISFEYDNNKFTYTIGGFTEEPLFGTLTNGALKIFLNDEGYKQLEERLGKEVLFNFLSVQLNERAKEVKLEQKLSEQIFGSGNTSSFLVMRTDVGLEGNRVFVNILAAILIVFALIMVVISLIVIRFQIFGNIEDNLTNIGVLKANGYTSRQIISSFLLQFVSVSIMASIPGSLISVLVMPLVGNMISSSVGLLWPTTFELLSALLSLLIVTVLILLVAYLSSRKIRRITPIAALQSGLLTHNFKKNHFQLASTSLNLQFALSLKSLFRQTKQNFMIVLIVAGLTFSSIFCSILNFNFKGDTSAVLDLVGLERTNLQLDLKKADHDPKIFAEVEAMSEVQKISILEGRVASIDDSSFMIRVSDDYAKLETQTVYKGRQPIFDNEIAISGVIAKMKNKSIGDEIPVTFNGVTQNYLVTGLSQQINQLGMVATITEDGMRKLQPNYSVQSINVYLKEGEDLQVFIQKLEERLPGQWNVTNILDMLESTLSTFTSAVSSMTAVITAVTIIVVSLILYLVIKTLIMKRKREFGILKGIGYTTFNLMTQITFSLFPVIVVGVLLGSLAGYFFSDSAFVLLLSSLGIYNVQLAVSLPQVLLLCAVILVVAYVVSMLVARRIRKVSVYDLIMD
ncbi:ABC transporter permease [Paenibacillus sp. FSL H8-0261]|uniref:ABC transporter permease n=1 Tax=Paenibacillus sp. FSL H8-0261 TaxID=2921381 RepID=UPI0032442CA1